MVSTPTSQPEPFYCCEIDPDLWQSGGPGFQNANSTGPLDTDEDTGRRALRSNPVRRSVSRQEESRVLVDLHCTRMPGAALGRASTRTDTTGGYPVGGTFYELGRPPALDQTGSEGGLTKVTSKCLGHTKAHRWSHLFGSSAAKTG